MAISSAVHPVRVEPSDADHKIVKTVTIADPPITDTPSRSKHFSKPSILCPKGGTLSPNQSQDKKSILVHKVHSSNDSFKNESDKQPRRHSDDNPVVSATKNKQTRHFKTTGNAQVPIRNMVAVSSTDKKFAPGTIQRSSSLKNPSRKPVLLQSNIKKAKDGSYDKRHSGEAQAGNRTGKNAHLNAQKKMLSQSKSHAKLPTNSVTKAILIDFRKILKSIYFDVTLDSFKRML